MIRTVKLFEPEHYVFEDGTVLDRDEVTVENIGKGRFCGRVKTVWADVEDDGCLYIWGNGYLWRYRGEVE